MSDLMPEAPEAPEIPEGAGDRTVESCDPAAPAPLGVERMPTGHPRVDAALERLGDADHLPAEGHLEVYEDVHRGLREALAALDAGPQPSPSYEHRS
ncbi:hypothetical protein AB0J57_29960 [Streptomyces sp. NPDC049837]|uniref:hypothetical protein n=1 Tax=Streptomyces sp. NPDC049837 TaxID=3155277 RepID=UPI0034239FE0